MGGDGRGEGWEEDGRGRAREGEGRQGGVDWERGKGKGKGWKKGGGEGGGEGVSDTVQQHTSNIATFPPANTRTDETNIPSFTKNRTPKLLKIREKGKKGKSNQQC